MKRYEVNSSKQVPYLAPGADGPSTRYRVYITTNKGASGWVDVRPEDWTTERLQEILSDKADELDLPFGLAG